VTGRWSQRRTSTFCSPSWNRSARCDGCSQGERCRCSSTSNNTGRYAGSILNTVTSFLLTTLFLLYFQNAADLILTEAGLSPIYGGVLEARRIFARIKSYVVYRIAASLILATTLSMVIYISGCVVDTLMVIILAFLNDISMVPVAYDNADATVKPQMARAKKLVALSIYYAVFHVMFSLIFFYEIADKKLDNFDLQTCNGATQGFVWLYLLIATELMVCSFYSVSLPRLSAHHTFCFLIIIGVVVSFSCHADFFSAGSFIFLEVVPIVVFAGVCPWDRRYGYPDRSVRQQVWYFGGKHWMDYSWKRNHFCITRYWKSVLPRTDW
jgi:hypothetical protein